MSFAVQMCLIIYHINPKILLYTSRGLDISQTAGSLSMEVHTAGTAGLFFDAKPLETLSAIWCIFSYFRYVSSGTFWLKYVDFFVGFWSFRCDESHRKGLNILRQNRRRVCIFWVEFCVGNCAGTHDNLVTKYFILRQEFCEKKAFYLLGRVIAKSHIYFFV